MANKLVSFWESAPLVINATNAKGVLDGVNGVLSKPYRYAIVLKREYSNLENNALITMIRWPNTENCAVLRLRNANYNILFVRPSVATSYDLITYENDCDVLYRSKPLDGKFPQTTWNTAETISYGVTRANEMVNEISAVAGWNVIVSIPDIDFNQMPETHGLYMGSILIKSDTVKGQYVRYYNGSISNQEGLSNSFDCQIEAGTKLVHFYI